MEDRRPSQANADLTDQRLDVIVELMLKGRARALDHEKSYHPEWGHDNWTVGTHSYANTVFLIEDAAASGDYSWLEILHPKPEFVFRIGGAPLRFGNGGEGQKPRAKLRLRHPSESDFLQTQLPLRDRQVPQAGAVWRFVFRVGLDLEYDRIHLIYDVPDGEHPIENFELYSRGTTGSTSADRGQDPGLPQVGRSIEEQDLNEAGGE